MHVLVASFQALPAFICSQGRCRLQLTQRWFEQSIVLTLGAMLHVLHGSMHMQEMHTGPGAGNMMYQMHLALNCSPHNLLQ
jgi:hypothetical protein